MKIHVLHTGKVRVSPYLPYGGNCGALKASGITTPSKDWIWLPVSCYLIEHHKGLILFDTGWHREMSPKGDYDWKAQTRSLGSYLLYRINQGVVEKGAAIDEQLAAMGIKPSDLDYVLLSHLDCDHANGLKAVAAAKKILVSRDEVKFAAKFGSNIIRYQPRWWKGVPMNQFEWNAKEGPASRSYDLFEDGSVQLINIPGHSDGLCALKLTGDDGRFVLLFSDGGYSTRSWKDMITSGIVADREAQLHSLEWIRDQSISPACVESLANHDPDVKPHTIEI